MKRISFLCPDNILGEAVVTLLKSFDRVEIDDLGDDLATRLVGTAP